MPLLEDPSQGFRTVALTQTPRPNYPKGKLPQVMGYSARTERFRYTEWRDFETGAVLARELYDHDADPMETANVVERLEYKKWLPELEAQLEKLVER